MNVVALLGSPRSGKNSATIATSFTATAAQLGAEIHTFELNKLNYRGCQGCYACKQHLDHCILQDDLTQVLNAVQAADLVLLASPVYYGDVTAQLKGFVDRAFSYLVPDYPTNPKPSRLAPKQLVLVLTQGHPDAALFADIFPRYEMFLKWMGFAECRLLRACGIGPGSVDQPPAEILQEAEALAREMVG